MSTSVKDKKSGKDGARSQSIGSGGQTIQITPDIISWAEWTDNEVNVEKWEVAAVKKGQSKKDQKKKGSPEKSGSAKTVESVKPQYEDTQQVPLPKSLRETCVWMRPASVFPGRPLVIFNADSDPGFDLIPSNWHLFHSTFVRSFVSAVSSLDYLGRTVNPPVEWQTTSYMASTSGISWKPWHHIYSGCRAGKDAKGHAPQVNLNGKYFVRVYWFGCWRKIVVDDRIPVADKRILLPVASVASGKVQLWPILLFKALLKIASLTWTDADELVDFDIVTSLTGWPVQYVDTRNLSSVDLWNMCAAYSADHYTWNKAADDRLKQYCTGERRVGSPEPGGEKSPDGRSKSKGDKSKNRSKSKGKEKGTIVSKGPSRFVFGSYAQTDDNGDRNGIDMLPCLPHDFVVMQTRDVICMDDLPDPSTELKPWKKVRWENWADKRGIRKRVLRPRRKLIKLYSGLRRQEPTELKDVAPSEQTLNFQKNVDLADLVALDKIPPALLPQSEKKQESRPSSKKSKSRSPAKQQELRPDTSIWCDFDWFAENMNGLRIYFVPTEFHTYVISNRELNSAPSAKQVASKKDTKKKGKEDVAAEQKSRRYMQWKVEPRNECFYIFLDSCGDKRMVTSLATICCEFSTKDLRNPPELQAEKKSLSVKKQPLRCRTGNCKQNCCCLLIEPEPEVVLPTDNRKKGYLLLETYNWKSEKIGEDMRGVGTFGIRTLLTRLSPGRHVLRCWLSGPADFIVILMCDTPLVIDGLEPILLQLSVESELVVKTYYDICTAFGNLVAGFGTPRYLEFVQLFRKAYMAGAILHKTDSSDIHRVFLEQLLEMISQRSVLKDLPPLIRALRVLFLEPNLGVLNIDEKSRLTSLQLSKKSEDKQYCLCDDTCQTDVQLKDHAATVIQAFFKRLYVQKLWKKHDPTHPDFWQVFESLKRIYMLIFSAEKRKNTGPEIVRRMASVPQIENSVKHFSYYRDLDHVVLLQRMEGSLTIADSDSWLLLAQNTFVCKSPEVVRIHAWCELQKYVLRVLNNENRSEIFHCTSATVVDTFESNANGYSALVYGWTCSRTSSPVRWRLTAFSQKRWSGPTIELRYSCLTARIISDIYMPTRTNIITKCILRTSENGIVTFRLSSTSKNALMKLRCTDASGNVLGEICGNSSIVLPVVKLLVHQQSERELPARVSISRQSSTASKRKSSLSRSVRNSEISEESIQFFLEATLEGGSWMLTGEEQKLADNRKMCDYLESEVASSVTSSESNKKLPSRGKISFQLPSAPDHPPMPSPRWLLCVIFDAASPVALEQNFKRRDEIKAIKRACFGDSLERLYLGKRLRQEFLERSNKTPDSREPSEMSQSCSTTSFISVKTTNICPICQKTIKEDDNKITQFTSMSSFMLALEYGRKMEKNRHTITIVDQEEFDFQLQNMLELSEMKQEQFLQDMEEYLEKNLLNNETMKCWYEGIRADSVEMMAYTDAMRAECIAKMAATGQKKGKGKDPKKEKKKK